MKPFIPITSKVLMLFFCLFSLSLGYSQDVKEKELTKKEKAAIKKRAQEEYENIENAFLDMFKKANADYVNTNSLTCDPFSYVKNLNDEQFITAEFRDVKRGMANFFEVSHLAGNNNLNFDVAYDKENFKTLQDKLLNASSNSKDFAGFISLFTGQSIADLSKNDLSSLKFFYDRLQFKPSSININPESIKITADCRAIIKSSYRQTSFSYPNSEWLFTSEVKYDCGCQEDSGQTALKNATYTYTSKVTSILTATNLIFNRTVSDPKLYISDAVCCPEEKENNSVSPKNIGDSSDNKRDVNKDYTVHFGIGLPLGNEADFYGFTYSVGLDRRIITLEDLDIGVSAGYSRFTGKETDFSFETEGVSFIPVEATLGYDLNDLFSLSGSVGYAFSATEGVDGGFTFSIGPELSICPSWDASLNYNSILLGDERSFNSVTGGIHFRF